MLRVCVCMKYILIKVVIVVKLVVVLIFIPQTKRLGLKASIKMDSSSQSVVVQEVWFWLQARQTYNHTPHHFCLVPLNETLQEMTVHTHFAFKSGHDFILTTLLEGISLQRRFVINCCLASARRKSVYTLIHYTQNCKNFSAKIVMKIVALI